MRGVTTYSDLKVVAESDAWVGKGPVFDPRTGLLVWSDTSRGRVFEEDPATGERIIISVVGTVGAVAPRESGPGFAAAAGIGFGFIGGGTLELVDPVLPDADSRMNDGKVDSRGRFWAGSSEVSGRAGGGRLHRWDGIRPSVVIAAGLIQPSGIGWGPEDDVMYLADSHGRVIYRAPYEADEGKIGRLDAFVEFRGLGQPYGLVVDAEGCLWVPLWGEGQLHRYDRTGRLVGAVPVPVSQPSGCAFGPDNCLYITSARRGLPARELARQPLAGSLFAVDPGTQGVPVHSFRA